MKTIKHIFLPLLLVGFVFFSCQKEYSFEVGNGNSSSGTLESTTNGECLGISVSGLYLSGLALDTGNYIVANVDISVAGAFAIGTDTVNGYYYYGIGSFPSPGLYAVKIFGQGTPLAAGLNVFTLSYDSSQCVFAVNVAPPGSGGSSEFTFDGSPNNCTGAVVNGIYTEGVALDAGNTVDIQVNVITAGTYSINTGTVNGMSFSATGSFATTGPQTITLVGTGTPAAAGDTNFPLNIGTTSCSFLITVEAGTPTGSIDWKFTEGATTYQGTTDGASLTAAGAAYTFGYIGSNSNDQLVITLIDVSGGVKANETYNTSSLTNNAGAFIFDNGTEIMSADPTTSGVSIVFKITSHDTNNKVIQGTFSGTAKSDGGATRTIKNGQFKGTYQ